MSEQAIDVFFIVAIVVPIVMVFILCLFMLVPVAIEEIARTIAGIKTAIEELKEAWRG